MHKIFIVEDDSVIAEAIAKSLCKWGYEVEISTDFKDILSEFENAVPIWFCSISPCPS